MNRLYRSLAAGAGLVLALGAGSLMVSAATSAALSPADSSAGKTALTFTKDVQPLAATRCRPCHANKMADYANIIAKKYVVPGKPEASLYYMNPAGKAHHPGGNVWKDKSDMIKEWIASGAPK